MTLAALNQGVIILIGVSVVLGLLLLLAFDYFDRTTQPVDRPGEVEPVE